MLHRKFIYTIVLCVLSIVSNAQGTRGEVIPPPSPEETEVKDSIVVYELVMVQELPQFPGGDSALRKYLNTNLLYPVIEREEAIQGKVYVEFVIDEFGGVSNAKIKRGVSRGLDAEAIRLIMNMPRWTPGKTTGKPVKVRYILPINFKLT
jgi:periplasmic protein TonB